MIQNKNNGLLFFIALASYGVSKISAELNEDIIRKLRENNSTKLSRIRRYLVFPESSSFLVIFDLTYPALAIQGNAFMFGHTAALSWELPSTPIFLNKTFLSKEKITTTTESHLEHIDYQPTGWNVPLVWNYPDSETMYDSQWQNNYDFRHTYKDPSLNKMYNPSNFWRRASYSKNPLNPKYPRKIVRTVAHHIQRRSRRELYKRIEKLLSALSKDGKQCVLKAICQVYQLPKKKGSMWQEILKAIFRAKHQEYPDEDIYDRATNKNHNCDQLYPNCDGHVLSNLFKNKL
ncbi:uncharacterized protein LOC126734215 [Anthonomus grandis grandis]|uniref:uncharacterized protein LOC126734215 n=1 Tax=Anthonomus grandis grandis TaxID=2921223 RepID=UPI002165A62E|nr:uncharacterized protein LOC126734215 [Anthonomus grandis grandis]